MNRVLPMRDRGDRSRTSLRQSGRRALVFGAVGLVVRTSHTERERPPRRNPGGPYRWLRLYSDLDRVAAFPIFALAGGDGQAHLLANSARQEPAHGMRLPAGGFYQPLCSDTPRLPQQSQDLVGLATLAGGLSLLRAFRRLLELGGLRTRLTFRLRHVGAFLRTTGLPSGFGLAFCGQGQGGGRFFCGRNHVFSFCGNHRNHIDHSGAAGKQVLSVSRERGWNPDEPSDIDWLPDSYGCH
jgi:hypothetical protein